MRLRAFIVGVALLSTSCVTLALDDSAPTNVTETTAEPSSTPSTVPATTRTTVTPLLAAGRNLDARCMTGAVRSDADSLTFDTGAIAAGDCIDDLGYVMKSELGFSEATMDRIAATRALDGEVSATSPDGYIAYWRYHPDSGLNITIEPG